jgi:hypothetical protein
MKRFFSIQWSFMLLLIFSSFSKPEKKATERFVKSFMGYIDQQPVFDSYAEKKLYVLRDGLELLTSYRSNYIVRAVKDKYICYNETTKTGHNLVVSCNGKEKKYHVSGDFNAIIDEKGTIYYNCFDVSKSIKRLSPGGQIQNMGINGELIEVADGGIYYLKHYPHTHSEMMRLDPPRTNADVFKFDLKTMTIQKIVSNISDMGTTILPGKKLIYKINFAPGEYTRITYSMEEQRYALLPLAEKYNNYSFYYSYQKKCLVFYDADIKDVLNVEIPTKFDNAWPLPDSLNSAYPFRH